MLSSCSVIAASLILVGYLVAYVVRHGMAVSISETYYHIRCKWQFSTVLAAVALLLFVPWVMSGVHGWCAFLSCFAVMLVSASPQFRDAWISRIHYGAAAVMGLCSVSWLIINGHHLYALFFAIGLSAADRKHWMWWLELGIFANVIIAILQSRPS